MLRGFLLFPLHGVFLIITIASLVLRLFALVDAISRPDAAFLAAGKQSKTFWLIALVVGLFLALIGVIASLIYLLDVRPALRGARGGSGRTSSSDGPYGPYRG